MRPPRSRRAAGTGRRRRTPRRLRPKGHDARLVPHEGDGGPREAPRLAGIDGSIQARVRRPRERRTVLGRDPGNAQVLEPVERHGGTAADGAPVSPFPRPACCNRPLQSRMDDIERVPRKGRKRPHTVFIGPPCASRRGPSVRARGRSAARPRGRPCRVSRWAAVLRRKGWWGRRAMTDPRTGETRLVRPGSPRRLRIVFDTDRRMACARGRATGFNPHPVPLPRLGEGGFFFAPRLGLRLPALPSRRERGIVLRSAGAVRTSLSPARKGSG